MHETCPVSTEGWTRRVHFVREGGGGGALLGEAHHDELPHRRGRRRGGGRRGGGGGGGGRRRGGAGRAMRGGGDSARVARGERERGLRLPRAAFEAAIVGEAQPLADSVALVHGKEPVDPAGVRDAACPLSTRGGTRLVRLVRGGGGGTCRSPSARGCRARTRARRRSGSADLCRGRRRPVCRRWTRRVRLVRRDGRDVSTLYGREGGGSCMSQMSSAPLLACHVKCENACPHRRVPSVWGQGTQRVRLVPGGRGVCSVSTRGCKGGGCLRGVALLVIPVPVVVVLYVLALPPRGGARDQGRRGCTARGGEICVRSVRGGRRSASGLYGAGGEIRVQVVPRCTFRRRTPASPGGPSAPARTPQGSRPAPPRRFEV